MNHIIVWGIGNEYRGIQNLIELWEKCGEFHVKAFVCGNGGPYESIKGIPVLAPGQLESTEFDYIIICSSKYFREIVNQALYLGISRERLIPYWVLRINGFHMNEYIKLVKSKISIFSNMCWGGVVSRNLGIECRSPLKNLWISGNDYIKLICNLSDYLKYPLCYAGYDEYDNGIKRDAPVMKLGDLNIHCNHYKSAEEAREAWNRRCGKVNMDNLFFMMEAKNEETAEQFVELPFHKKICIVDFKTDLPNCVYVHRESGEARWRAVMMETGFGISFDIIKLLLTGQYISFAQRREE